MNNMFEKLKDLYDDNLIRDFFRNINYGIKNFWRWKSVIWNDRNFDYYFFFVILHKKLFEMYKSFSKNDIYVGQDKDAKNIKICVNLLNRIMEKNEFDYMEMAFRYHDRKWGKMSVDFIPYEDNPDYSKFISNRPNIKTDKDREKENKEFLKCCYNWGYSENQDREYLFRIINRHIDKWWT